MKKVLKSAIALLMTIAIVITFILPTTSVQAKTWDEGFRSVGYFYQESGDINEIDVTKITHLNYSFGLIYHDEALNEQNVPNDPEKLHTIYLPDKVKSDLKQIPELKKKNPNLKVLLSVGGWGCRGFSALASTAEGRKKFANSALEIVKEYNLDGIDIDWEYPVNGGWGVIDSKPEDKENYTLLLKTLRQTLPRKTLLTIAAAANPSFIKEWTDFESIVQYLDFVNIMTYDLGYGTQYFNSNLYDSKDWPTKLEGDKFSVDYVVSNYLNTGVSPSFFNVGMAFYGRVPKVAIESAMDWSTGEYATNPYFTDREIGIFNDKGLDIIGDTYIRYNDIVDKLISDPNFIEKWDDDAKCPYLMIKDKDGKELFAVSYENEKSLKIKADYVRNMGLGGAMFWDYSGDKDNKLATSIAEELDIWRDTTKPDRWGDIWE